MVQIINDPTRGNIFGRIGKGLGQGLSEQIPKEAERFRLSQGLQNLAQNAGNLTPLQQAAEYLPILQNNPAALQILPALLQQQRQRQEGNNLTQQGNQQIPQTLTQPSPSQENANTLDTRAPLDTALGYVGMPAPEQLQQEAQDLSVNNPATFPTWKDALPFVTNQHQQRVNNLQDVIFQGERQRSIQDRTEKAIKQDWGNRQASIPGDIQQKLLQDAIGELKKGNLTENAIRNKYGKKGLEIGKTFTNLESLGAESMIDKNKTAQSSRRRLDTMVDQAKKYDFQNDFADKMSATQQTTQPFSRYITYPINDNKKNFHYIKRLDNIENPATLTENTGDYGFVRGKGVVNKIEATDRIIDEIGKNWTEKDSPLSYAYALKRKGYDPQRFLNQLQEKFGDKFSPEQAQEYEKSASFNPTLGDVFLSWDIDLPLYEGSR